MVRTHRGSARHFLLALGCAAPLALAAPAFAAEPETAPIPQEAPKEAPKADAPPAAKEQPPAEAPKPEAPVQTPAKEEPAVEPPASEDRAAVELVVPADQAGDEGLPEEEARERAARAFLKGNDEGALGHPLAIGTEDKAEQICAALGGTTEIKGEKAPFVRPTRRELKAQRDAAAHKVYRALVSAGNFKVGEYRPAKGLLPLKLDRSLVGLDGALILSVMKKEGGAFHLGAKEAEDLAQRIEAKQVALEIVFQVDDAPGLSACFSYPKSATYSIRIEPLTYALIDVATQKPIASTSTPALRELREWIEPGAPTLRLAAHSADGVIDEALTGALEAKRGQVQGCLDSVMRSADGTAVLGFSATAAPGSSLRDLQLDFQTLGQDPAAACVQKALASVVARGARASRVEIMVTVDRDGPDQVTEGRE